MKKYIKPFSVFFTLLTVAFFFIVLFPAFQSSAENTMDNVFLYLSRIENDLDGSEGEEVEMILVFETTQEFAAGGTIEMFFQMEDDNEGIGSWCRNEGALTVEGVDETDIPPAPGVGGVVFELPAETTLAATCSEGENGVVGDSIEITGLDALTENTIYGVKIENGAGSTGVLGTSPNTGEKTVAIQLVQGADMDHRAVSIYLIETDTVIVTAEVMEVPTVSCTLNTETVIMPALFPGGVMRTVLVETALTTSAPTGTAGFYWAAYGLGDGEGQAGLHHDGGTPYTLDSHDGVNGFVNLLPGNSEGFGINIVNPAAGTTVPTDFNGTVVGRFGAIDAGPDGARLIWYKTATAAGDTADIEYGARASEAASTGGYTEEITYVCGGYY